MFSVNIDKLIKMTTQEKEGYSLLADTIIEKCEGRIKTIATVGEGIAAFKMASALVEKDNKVLFVDADFTDDIFISKYRLGKSLKGVTDYFKGNISADSLLCYSNNDNLDLIFTGDINKLVGKVTPWDMVKRLFKDLEEDYDYIIVQSDSNGKTAACCDTTIVMTKADEYTAVTSETKVSGLDVKGCYVLGVVVYE